MKVLVVSDLYPPVAYGGYERECATAVRHLAETHEVLVLTTDKDAAGVPAEAHVRRTVPTTWGTGRRDVTTAPFTSARAVRVMRETLADFRPDLVYVFGMQTAPHAILTVVADAGVPLACRFCVPSAGSVYLGDRFMRYLGPPGGRGGAVAAVVRLANHLIPDLRLDGRRPLRTAVSWASDALRTGMPASGAVETLLERVIHPASDAAERLATLPRRTSAAGRPRLAYVGRVLTEKGPEVAVRALAMLRDDHGVEAELELAGWCGPGMADVVERLARSLDVEHLVTLRGQLEGDELALVYQGADVVLVPSLVWEALGLVCVESALARAPVVASRVGGIPEALRHEREALLFEPGDAAACAAAVADTLGRPDATAARVQAAFTRARDEFSVEGYLAATERFLADALEAA